LATDRLVPSQYSTIQAAIDDCNDGDVVIVEPNTYTGPDNRDIDFKGLEITVRSTKPNDPNVVAATVIDCQNSGRGFYFHSGEDSHSVLDGLTVTNGLGDRDGGGIYCVGSSPTISRCVITGNKGKDGTYKAYETGGSGGGIYCSGSSAILNECTIKNNITGAGSFDVAPEVDSGDGGGIYCISSSLTIRDCIIGNNRTKQGVDGYFNTESNSGSGGGIYCESSTLEITDSAVTSNAVQRGGQADFAQAKTGDGGGIYCISCPSVSISGCEISNNVTGNGTESRSGCRPGGFGGGIYCGSSTIMLMDSIINGNITGRGGSVYFGGLGCDGGHGGGIYCTSSTAIANNCTISNNITGAGASEMEFKGGNGGDGAGFYCGAACSITLNNCCITGNITGSGGNVSYYYGDGGDGGDGGGICLALYNVIAAIRNCTISANQTGAGGSGGPEGGVNGSYGIGAGAFVITSTSITDTIIWGNSPDELVGHSCSKINHCDIGGGICVGAGNNISAEPLFVTGPLGDYYLSQIAAGQVIDSPCMDTGSDTAANLGMNIFTTRTNQICDAGIVDIGYHYFISNPADIDMQGGVDFIDYAILTSQWKQIPGVPSADIAPLCGDGIVDEKDFNFLVESWLLGK
jgi:hypothetical protein